MFIAPNEIRTKIVGVTMSDGPIKPGSPSPRQLYLAAIKRQHKDRKIPYKNIQVELRPEDTNEYDKDAIAVVARLLGTTMKLGYIQNKRRVCMECGTEYDLPRGEAIPYTCTCGSLLTRNGLASDIREAIRKGFQYSVIITDITGGDGVGPDGTPKNLGCNIIIRVKN